MIAITTSSSISVKPRRDVDRIRCFGEHVAGASYDVVLVQELFLFKLGPLGSTTNFEACAAAMRRAGLPHYTNPLSSMHDDRRLGQNSGVAIFSRWPIVDEVAVHLVTSEPNNTKGMVMATVNVRVHGPYVEQFYLPLVACLGLKLLLFPGFRERSCFTGKGATRDMTL